MVSAVVGGLLVALLAVAVLVFNRPLGELLPFLKIGSLPKNRTVIVVGGGLAGMSAASEAVQNGATVILIDKEKGSGFPLCMSLAIGLRRLRRHCVASEIASRNVLIPFVHLVNCCC